MAVFLSALVFALIFNGILYATADTSERVPFFTTLPALFLPLWALALWLPPFGPTLFGVMWLELFVLGLLLSLFIAAVTSAVVPRAPVDEFGQNVARVGARGRVNAFLWIFAAGILILIAAGYVEPEIDWAH
jgi:hypothetical protein